MRALALTLLLSLPSFAAPSSASAAAVDATAAGRALYEKHCAGCHAQADERTGPSLASLRGMHPAQLRFALTRGRMREQASALKRDELQRLVSYLGAGNGDAAVPESAWCATGARAVTLQPVYVGRWGLDAHNTRHQPPGLTRINAANVGTLQLQWAFGLPGATEGRSQPVITEDTVFAMATPGQVYALDRASGCIKWRYETAVPLRTSLSLGTSGDRAALFVGDTSATVHALDARTGTALWHRSVGLFDTSTLTGGLIPHDDLLVVPLSSFEVAAAADPEYECCRSHGAVMALDAASGEIRWTHRTTPPAVKTFESSRGIQQWGPSGAPVWSTPAVDAKRGLLYVGTGENTSSPPTHASDAILALEIASGQVRWTYQGTAGDAFNMACGRRQGPNCPPENGPDFDFGASVILLAGDAATGTPDILLAGQKSGTVHALNPEDGTLLWQRSLSDGTALGGVHWGMALAEGRLFVPIADPEFPAPDYRPRPGLHALDAATGEVLWSYRAERGCALDRDALGATAWPDCPYAYGYSAAATAATGVVFAAALNGRVQAFDSATGALLWDVATVRPYRAVNGVATHGGAIDNAGVQLADDMLFVQSGYGMFGQMPGNALLAFRLVPR